MTLNTRGEWRTGPLGGDSIRPKLCICGNIGCRVADPRRFGTPSRLAPDVTVRLSILSDGTLSISGLKISETWGHHAGQGLRDQGVIGRLEMGEQATSASAGASSRKQTCHPRPFACGPYSDISPMFSFNRCTAQRTRLFLYENLRCYLGRLSAPSPSSMSVHREKVRDKPILRLPFFMNLD